MSAKEKPKTKAPAKTLVDFIRAKKRAGCKVCALSDDIRSQLATVRDKKIPRRDVLDWLRTECGAAATDADLTTHTNGHHDDR